MVSHIEKHFKTDHSKVHKHILIWFLFIFPLFPPGLGSAPRFISFLAVSLFSLYIIVRGKKLYYHKSICPLLLFLVFVFMSTLFSHYPLEAWLGHSGYLTGFYSYICFNVLYLFAYSYSLKHHQNVNSIIQLWLISVTVISSIGLLQYFGLNLVPFYNEVFQHSQSYSTIGNSNDLGTFLLMALPFAAYYILKGINYKSLVVFVLVYGVFLTTLCRSAWIGLGVGMPLLLFHYPEKKNIYKMVMIMVIVTLVLLPWNGWKLAKQITTISGEAELAMDGDPAAGSSRMFLWQEGVKVLPKSIIIGSGPDTFYYAAEEKFSQRFWEKARPASKAHNIFLEIAVTMGIPALIFYIWFLLSILKGTNRKDPFQYAFYLMVIMYIVRGQFLVDVISVYPTFWILVGFYQGLKDSSQSLA